MKNKLKFIIPIVIAVIAIIVAALCIDFTPAERVDIPSLVSTAQKYLIENNYEQAIAEFNKIIEIDPINVDAYIGIADAYIGIGDTEKAIEWLQKGYELTGNERLKAMIDKLNSDDEVTVTAMETSALTEADTTSEPIKNEVKISYADEWYSIFKYENKNIVGMELYDMSGNKRLNANYEYIGNEVERTVYVDDVLYSTENVTFGDIMAEEEKLKKERANTREEHDNNWWVYDENGDCIEHGWHNLDSDGNPTNDSGEDWYYNNGKIYKTHDYFYSLGWEHNTYYDGKGYPLKREGNGYGNGHDNITYTYEYDEYGYPIIQYQNGKKCTEYINFYNDNKFVYAISHFEDEYNDIHSFEINNNYDGGEGSTELNENGQYIRYINHINTLYTYAIYYIPSFDGTKMIDSIWIDCSNIKPLFECPYCNN